MHKECTKDIESKTFILCASDHGLYTDVQRAGFVVMEWQRQMNEVESSGNEILLAWLQLKLSVEWKHEYSCTSDQASDQMRCGMASTH